MQLPRVGDTNEKEYVVKKEDSPEFLAKEGLGVLSTPRMIALMEITSKELLDRIIGDEYTSVGIHVDVYHKNPAPIGAKLRFVSRVIEVKGRKVIFEVRCFMNDTVIGEGVHERFVIEWDKFREKIRSLYK
ncbi:MAG: thioesterase family protein [Crenarchaeota archaeon]|nr:thioesterase family protein [Thermoproteota archaeon]